MLQIRARVIVKPTEDEARVAQALTNIFPGTVPTREGDHLVVEAADLARLRELIRNGRIPDTARGVMLGGLSEDGMRASFRLGKQAAAVGRAHFGSIRGPLGDIDVDIVGTDPGEVERAIYHAAPDTTVAAELAEVPASQRPALP
ncbi:MAG: RNA-binding domain-containing protein [Candidatus Thermoplasmatota archaeon]